MLYMPPLLPNTIDSVQTLFGTHCLQKAVDALNTTVRADNPGHIICLEYTVTLDINNKFKDENLNWA